ncbi:MAG TPA: nicotinate (nicotinamide) nucleotide adenylyltransferase [Methylibium sp.]|nr:nicotinate (nicotinamide) nucleotide adenylyltransferase [Methylibium sp.]
MQRVGLFGGSFDPPHAGHLQLAHTALASLALDELLWIPAGQPWQRQHRLAGGEQRAAMVAAAIAGEPRFVLDPRELRRGGPSYTLDTVRELEAERPGAELFLLIGEDQYQRLPTWHGWRELPTRVTLAVAGRGAQRPPPAALGEVAHRMLRLPMVPMDVSATAIRSHLAAGGEAADLVPSLMPTEVARYIDSHRLYREPAAPPARS